MIMKNKLILGLALSIAVIATSCQDVEKKKVKQEGAVIENNGAQISGEYYYSDEGAVLKGSSFIYAVAMDERAKELGARVAKVKNDIYDMVPVVVRGTVKRNPALKEGQEVWEQLLTIKEILSVGNAPAEVDIKIREEKKANASN